MLGQGTPSLSRAFALVGLPQNLYRHLDRTMLAAGLPRSCPAGTSRPALRPGLPARSQARAQTRRRTRIIRRDGPSSGNASTSESNLTVEPSEQGALITLACPNRAGGWRECC